MEAFADVETKVVETEAANNLVFVKSSSLYSRLQKAYEEGDRGTCLNAITRASLYFYGDQPDFIYIFPSVTLPGQYNYGQFFRWTDTNIASTLKGYITFNGYTNMGTIAFMHELGHNWFFFLSDLLPNNQVGQFTHWGVAALDKRGQLGGFTRSAITCTNPNGRIPSTSASCTAEANGKVNIRVDWALGAPSSSHDGTGGFAKMELFIMGLLTYEEVKDEWVTYCEITYTEYANARGPQGTGDVVPCDVLHIVTAAQIQQGMNANLRMQPGGTLPNNLKVATVVLFDSELPASVSDATDEVKWLSNYIDTRPAVWAQSTNNRSTLSFKIDESNVTIPIADNVAIGTEHFSNCYLILIVSLIFGPLIY